MKVAIGYCVQDGPWGGGNRFVGALVEALQAKGDSVFFDLSRSDLDFIIIIDPRSRLDNIPFSAGDVLRYLAFKNPRALVVHRINECDERKNTRTMNSRLRLANYCADHTVFVGTWLKELDLWNSGGSKSNSVILNGADTEIYHSNGFKPWNGNGPLRMVTHHWGGNWMKGFDVYTQIDNMLDDQSWRNRLDFTYIGNLPKGLSFRNIHHIKPLNGDELADEIRKHHGYLTASINEPGGNHQNEGALCGLPIMYRNSGCLPEYIDGYGQIFEGPEDFETAFSEYEKNYPRLVERMAHYPHRSSRCIGEWMSLFKTLAAERDAIVESRRLWRDPVTFLINQLPV